VHWWRVAIDGHREHGGKAQSAGTAAIDEKETIVVISPANPIRSALQVSASV